MTPIQYEVVGEEEYALKICVEEDGRYTVHSGDYATRPPRKGQLDDEQAQALIDGIKALGLPREHPMPTSGGAFEAHLTIGGPGNEISYVFWEGALEDDMPLNTLIRQLERL